MRTKSEAKVLETDVVIFQMKLGENETEAVLNQDLKKTQTNEANSNKIADEGRFMRLRKSLRKRSASIL